MLEAVFHWSMFLYYGYADSTTIKGLMNAHALRGREPDDVSTDRMIYGAPTYITIWNMLFQQIYFTMCCKEHLMGLFADKRSREGAQRTRMLILRSVLFPTTCVVAILYWWVYWESPLLIFGDILAELYPAWVDHAMHTFIVPIALLELYLSASPERAAEGGNIKGWIVFSTFLTVYTTTVIIAHFIRGVWPYPFLDPVNNGNPVLFFLYLYATGWFWYFVGMYLTHKVWGSCSESREKSHPH